jgi:four helix bundle protein
MKKVEHPRVEKAEHPTSNIQHPTSNQEQRKRRYGVEGGSGERKAEHPTPNIQHPTSNEEGRKRRFDLEERMLAHAVRIVALYDSLPAGSGARQIGNQLIRSGTSPYLHHGEVEAAESLDDFVHKLKVCLKELRETWRALRLLQRAARLSNSGEIDSLIKETQELIRIFYQSVRTVRQRHEPTSRIREEVPAASDWMLDVGCWMLDVEAGGMSDVAVGTNPPSRL